MVATIAVHPDGISGWPKPSCLLHAERKTCYGSQSLRSRLLVYLPACGFPDGLRQQWQFKLGVSGRTLLSGRGDYGNQGFVTKESERQNIQRPLHGERNPRWS